MFENIDWFDFVVGGIIIGFIVNVAANFAQPKIDRWWSNYSEAQRNKKEAKKQAFDAMVENLVNNKHEEIIARIQANRLDIFGNGMLTLSTIPAIWVIMLQQSNVILFVGCAILFILCFGRATNAMIERNYLVQILSAVDKKLGRKFR